METPEPLIDLLLILSILGNALILWLAKSDGAKGRFYRGLLKILGLIYDSTEKHDGDTEMNFQNRATFVDTRPSEAVKKQLKAAMTSGEVSEQNLWSLIAEGDYKLSVSHPQDKQSFQVFLIPRDPKGPNGGYILTARNADLAKAFCQLVWYHVVVSEGDWQSAYDTGDSDW